MERETGMEPAAQPLGFKTEWSKREDLPGFSPLPGVRMAVYSGGRMMMNFYTIQPGATIGWHSHPHEQCGTILEGEIHLRVGTPDAEPWVLRKGDVYAIAPDTPHSGTAGPDGVVALDIFAPPREDYLTHAQAGRDGAEGTYLSASGGEATAPGASSPRRGM
ncbi:MAG: cupin domain-containing protein [Thermomicrobiales bacterium]